MRATIGFVLSLMLAAAIAAQEAAKPALEGTEIATVTDFPAGTRLKSTPLGLSFEVPAGVTASVSPNGNAIVLKGAARVGVIVARTGLTAAQAMALFSEEMDLTFLHDDAWLERTGAPATQSKRVSVDYAGEDMAGHALALLGDSAGIACVIADATPERARDAAKKLVDGAVFTAPASDVAIATWKGRIENRRLSVSAGEESITLECDIEGAYKLRYHDGEQEYTEEGKWHIELGLMCGCLVLGPARGDEKTLALTMRGDDLLIDGTVYTRTPLAAKPAEARKPGPAPDAPDAPTPPPALPPEAADKGKSRIVKADPDWKSDLKESELEGDEILYGSVYAGGKRLKTEFLGLSFVMPQGVKGGCDGKSPAFGLHPEDQRSVGLVFMQTGMNGPSAATLLQDEQDLSELEKGVVLKPDGEAVIKGGRVSQDYAHETYYARAIVMIGPSGNALGATFIGLRADREKLNQYVESIASSVQFAKPKALERRDEIRKRLGGKCLHVARYQSAQSGPGNYGNWQTKIWYHLGSDGTFEYRYLYTSVIGIGDSGGTRKEERSDAGAWRIEFNLAGVALILESAKTGQTTHSLVEQGETALLNGERASVIASDLKQ